MSPARIAKYPPIIGDGLDVHRDLIHHRRVLGDEHEEERQPRHGQV